MRFINCLGHGGRLVSFAVVLSTLASADTILFQRALPSGANVNAAGASRSNVDWINPTDNSSNFFINGDDFTVSGQDWQISSISVFIVLNKVGDTPSAEFSNFSLYLAQDTGDQQPQNFSVASTNVTPTPVTFPGSTSACSGAYLASDGVTCLPVYMMTFNISPNLVLGPGKYDYAANGTLQNGLTGCAGTCGWYNLAVASNTALDGGSTENGVDNLYLDWFASSPSQTNVINNFDQGYVTVNSAPACAGKPADVCGGWDKSSDMNVVVTGTTVPEPGTMTLFGLAGLAVVIAKIRRRRVSSIR